MRVSALLACAPVITRHPASLAHASHCAASAGSISAMAGDCAAALDTSRLIMPQARTDLFDQFFDVIRFFQRGDGQYEPLVFLQVLLQLLREDLEKNRSEEHTSE